MTRLLAIDPGTTESAWVMYIDGAPVSWAKQDNHTVLEHVRSGAGNPTRFAMETIASYGMAVGATVFTTCQWSGRFVEAWENRTGIDAIAVYRRDVKLHLCGTSRAKDANVRQSLIDKYGPDKATAIGIKKAPGPLYGMKADCWAALAVAVTVNDTVSP